MLGWRVFCSLPESSHPCYGSQTSYLKLIPECYGKRPNALVISIRRLPAAYPTVCALDRGGKSEADEASGGWAEAQNRRDRPGAVGFGAARLRRAGEALRGYLLPSPVSKSTGALAPADNRPAWSADRG